MTGALIEQEFRCEFEIGIFRTVGVMSPPGIWEHLDTLSCYTTAAATVNSHRCESSKVGLGKGQKDEEKIEMKNSGY